MDFFHSFSGLLIFIFYIPVLFAGMKILEKLPPVKKDFSMVQQENSSRKMNIGKDEQRKEAYKESEKKNEYRSLRKPVFAVTVTLIIKNLGHLK